ncbi:transposase [Christensenellaceae bacterium OttesenSCG-928-K19]|nr:transposase [Christensenellaceae bacterium OttesenSCG-928-K19]
MKKRTRYTAEFKTEVVLKVLREEDTVNAIASDYGINPVMVSRWKKEFLERAPEVFASGASDAEKELEQECQRIERLEQKVGQLTYELDWVKKKKQKSGNGSIGTADELIEHGNARISVRRQCELLDITRSDVYREPPAPKLLSDEEL